MRSVGQDSSNLLQGTSVATLLKIGKLGSALGQF